MDNYQGELGQFQYEFIIDPKTGHRVDVGSQRYFEIIEEAGEEPIIQPPIDPQFVQPNPIDIIEGQETIIENLREQVAHQNFLLSQYESGVQLGPKYFGDVSMYSSPILSPRNVPGSFDSRMPGVLNGVEVPVSATMSTASPRVSPRDMTPQVNNLQPVSPRGRSPRPMDVSPRRREISPQRVSPTGSYYISSQQRGRSPRRTDFYDSSPRQRGSPQRSAYRSPQRSAYRSPQRSTYRSSPPRRGYRSPSPSSGYRSPLPRSTYRGSPLRGRYGDQGSDVSCYFCEKYIHDEESEILTGEPKDRDYYRRFADVCSDCRRNARQGLERQGVNPEDFPGYRRHVKNEAYALNKYANSL